MPPCHHIEGTYSIVLVAVVDSQLRIVCIDVGAYGSQSDGGVFKASKIGKLLSQERHVDEVDTFGNLVEGQWRQKLRRMLTLICSIMLPKFFIERFVKFSGLCGHLVLRWHFTFSWEPHVFVHPPRRRRTKPSSPVVRPPTALAESRRRVASVFTMDVQVAGQDISPEEVTAQSGWLTARSRRSKRGTDNSTVTDESSQAPSNRPRSRARQPFKAQVLKAGPHATPSDGGYQDCNPPQGRPSYSQDRQSCAKLTDEESLEDTVCPNKQQNIVVVSTPHSDHADRYARISSIQVNGVTHEVNAYESAVEHTTKGVIRGIPLTETPQQIHNKIVTARNPTALAAKRIASTTTVIIAFDGPDVPFSCATAPRYSHVRYIGSKLTFAISVAASDPYGRLSLPK
ncbi:hypothetical protein HPB49_012759 [Dermacentor silvarum]|uniref:Uncharacterized protein n=1 Tax=Dermacentor silvarum TaxID=543639 RepID=A0ACB8CR90_DERSI|nr:hypothetical protein HPB49_012759 [Dermacentor silvarum]